MVLERTALHTTRDDIRVPYHHHSPYTISSPTERLCGLSSKHLDRLDVHIGTIHLPSRYNLSGVGQEAVSVAHLVCVRNASNFILKSKKEILN